MARPKKQPGELRNAPLAFRLTPSERMLIEDAARNAGVSASEYARELTLNGRVVINKHRSLDPAIFEQLRSIGVNLNQLTRMAHIREEMPPALPDLLDTIEEFLARELSGYGRS